MILFHPYDKGRWGFDAMSNEVNVRYIKYITARLASFRNVWWSMANEWDYVKAKTVDDWKLLTKTVVENDPYRHLCSIHGATATYFDYWMPEFAVGDLVLKGTDNTDKVVSLIKEYIAEHDEAPITADALGTINIKPTRSAYMTSRNNFLY